MIIQPIVLENDNSERKLRFLQSRHPSLARVPAPDLRSPAQDDGFKGKGRPGKQAKNDNHHSQQWLD
jgi:hypothetical protein